MNMQEAFIKMSDAVQEGDTDALVGIIEKIIGEVDPLILVQQGMMPGLKKIGELFESGEVFLPEMLMAAEAFKDGMKIIEPKLQESGKKVESLGTVVFGTVFSDIHEIGKNIVITLMGTYGFKVIDLGANVSPTKFVDES